MDEDDKDFIIPGARPDTTEKIRHKHHANANLQGNKWVVVIKQQDNKGKVKWNLKKNPRKTIKNSSFLGLEQIATHFQSTAWKFLREIDLGKFSLQNCSFNRFEGFEIQSLNVEMAW